MGDNNISGLVPNAPPTASYTPGDVRVATKTLGQDDFLKLLVAQFTHQDPLNPKADADYIGQMATFSNLEATKNMSNEFSLLRANSMLGRDVVVQPTPDPVTGAIADTVTGSVSQILASEGKPVLLINGGRYTLQQVLSISQPVTNTPVTPARGPVATVSQ